MKSLIQYIQESLHPIFEGGAGGHMAHPFDYTDFTANDLIELVDSLFRGKVEQLKEKLDGFNISASMNNDGEIIFIRNETERNSPDGGILLKNLDARWDGKEQQKKVYVMAGKIIEKIFPKLGVKYFNQDSTHRKVINCECIIAGQTNIMPYASDRVAFHGYQIWELDGNKWKFKEDVEGNVDDIYKAAEGIDEAKPRPNLVIRSLEDGIKFAEKFTKDISKLWSDEGLNNAASVDEWKKSRFHKLAPAWCKDDERLYNRLCNGDKSVNLRILKKEYADHVDELNELDKKEGKKLVGNIMEPMDNLFLSIGNELIDLLDGFVNSENKDKIIEIIKKDSKELVNTIEQSDSVDAKDKIEKYMQRLQGLGNKYNAAEGIVIMWKGRRMKFTGSFSLINKILGERFNLK